MINQTETKRQSALSVETNDEGLTITFANGKRLSLNVAALTRDIVRTATVHGLKQKLVDAAAISRNPDTGRSATVDDKYNAVCEVYERLLDGNWNAPREGGGGAQSLLLAAMVRFSGKDAATVKTWLEGKTDAEKKALSLNPKVASIINDIRAERAKTDGIDADSLLNELQ